DVVEQAGFGAHGPYNSRQELRTYSCKERRSMRRTIPALALLAGLVAVTLVPARDKTMNYPTTRRVEHTADYHGTKVADPYRWREEDVRKSKDVEAWVAAENKVTFAYLKSIPQRKAIHKRVKDLWNYERYSAPFKAGGRYFLFRNDGLQDQSVL